MKSNFFDGNLAFVRCHDQLAMFILENVKTIFSNAKAFEVLFHMSIIFSHMSDFRNNRPRLSPHPLTDFPVDGWS